MPSLFREDDTRLKLSINTETGLWQDFVSGETGNFAQLYAKVENKSYHAAESELLIRSLFKGETKKNPELKKKVDKEYQLPATLEGVSASSYDSTDPLTQKAWSFLYERKLFDLEDDKLVYYLGREGKFKNRLIIPFIQNDVMFYFQARALSGEFPKYMNPAVEENALKPSTILYPYDEEASSLVVCEGPLDAISLQLHGVNATCTMGCSVSETQMEILRDFKGEIILGYDNDEAGLRGIQKFDRLRKQKMMGEFSVCNPPTGCKDWNEAHVKGENLKVWVLDWKLKYDYEYMILNSLHLS